MILLKIYDDVNYILTCTFADRIATDAYFFAEKDIKIECVVAT